MRARGLYRGLGSSGDKHYEYSLYDAEGVMKREGSLEHCSVCRAALSAPIAAYGHTHCPRCNGQLWHLALPSGTTFFARHAGESIYDLMASLSDSRHGFTAADLEATLRNADSVDVVEFLAQLEGTEKP